MTDARTARTSTQVFEVNDPDIEIARVSTQAFEVRDPDLEISRVSIQAFVVTAAAPTFAMRAGMVPL